MSDTTDCHVCGSYGEVYENHGTETRPDDVLVTCAACGGKGYTTEKDFLKKEPVDPAKALADATEALVRKARTLNPLWYLTGIR